MITNFTNSLSNMDKNSQFLLIIIFIIVLLLFFIFIINSINSRRAKKYLERKNEYKRKLREEIDLEAKNILNETVKVERKIKPVEEEIEVLEEEKDEIDNIIDDIKINSGISNLDLTEFEREQEESAIISYEELCMKHGVPQKKYNKSEEKVIEKVSNIVENKEETHKFKPTKYVSPIFGLEKEEINDQAFLSNLKEFRSGLE